jgi:hypothetical protein
VPADRSKGFGGEVISSFKTHDISAQQMLILGEEVLGKKELKR